MQKILEKLTILALILTWLSHLVQVFTPEVGFDAVWYHLPVVKAIIEQQKLVYLPELYQSVNPLFSDLIFALGFFFAKELGVKIVAYLFGLSLAVASYFLSRKLLNHFWSLLVVLIISTFQVVAWQSSSFYVDVAKAFWEITSLLSLVSWFNSQDNKYLLISGLLLGASLATKLFSIFLLPVFLLLVFSWIKKDKIVNLIKFIISSLLLSLPFYAFTFLKTGTPFFSFSQHLNKLGEIGGSESAVLYFFQRTKLILTLPYQLIFARDYTSFLLILFLPVIFYYYKKIVNHQLLLGLTLFTLWQIALWWYLPPLSTRYALAGFIIWTVIAIWGVSSLVKTKPQFYYPILASIALGVLINLAPRMMVNWRSLKYLSGQQNKKEYIHQFFDGNIDQHLEKWYQLN